MDNMKVHIDLKPLSDEQIKASKFTLADLWMVHVPSQEPCGPFDTITLRDYSQNFQFIFENAKVYNLQEDSWQDFFSVPHFQRRKPQLVSAQNLISTQEFYILFNGQKDGPHSQESIQKMLDEGHIAPSTQLSLDSGKSWIKLYEHHAFDRRTKKTNQELPFKPNNIVDQVNDKKEKLKSANETEDAIVGLAYFGETRANINLEALQFKSNKKKLPNLRTKFKRKKQFKTEASPKAKKPIWIKLGTATMAIALAIGYFLTPAPVGKSTIKPRLEARTKPTSIDNSERSPIKRSPASIKPVNRMKKFKPSFKPKRISRQKQQRKRFYEEKKAHAVKKRQKSAIFENEIENIDINDPEVQEELTRQLAGEYEEEEENVDQFYDDLAKDPEDDLEHPYDNEQEMIEHENY